LLHYEEIIKDQLLESAKIKQKFLASNINVINSAAEKLVFAVKNGRKILLCGNGGSAADAQHLAAELVAKLKLRRKAIPALALTTDTSLLTAISNDDDFFEVFSRQVEAFGKKDDILLGISTSGNSKNVLQAVEQAKKQQMFTIVLTGNSGGKLKEIADLTLIVPSENTQRIQECHITVGHILCDILEQSVFNAE
jgi:D-sedoheptulose 7-phosphate isomerase